jgi:succinate dehydrogenase/fumarate reductase-like Fe-S protein
MYILRKGNWCGQCKKLITTQERALQERDKMKEENNKDLTIEPMHALIGILVW